MGYRLDKKYFDEQQAMDANKIEDIITDENILWEERPQKSAYIWNRILSMMPIALIWLAFDGLFLYMIFGSNMAGSIPREVLIFVVVFFAIHLMPVWIWIANIVKGVAGHKNVHYVITDRRLLVRSGIIPDIKIVDFASIESVVCKVGLVDRILHVGDIYITYAGNMVVLFDISNPYQISGILQRIVADIKADIQYPNALRPDNNPGYNTQYNTDSSEGGNI